MIERIAAGGDGVGRLPDGRVVFVPRTAPGDVARVALVREHPRFVRARLTALDEPGPDRREPPCRHYRVDDCGGCQLQHLTDSAQLAARRAIVGDALRRLGGLEQDDPPIEPALSPLAYRTRITVASGGGRRQLGFHQVGRPGRVFDLERCEIAREPLNTLWTGVREARALLPPTTEHVGLREDRDGGLHVIVEARLGPAWTSAGALADRLGAGGTGAAVWWRPAGGAPRVMAGRRHPEATIVFEQVHPVMGDRARRYAVASLGALSGRVVWDLYAGIGETAELLALAGARVVSVESDPRATSAARARHAARALDIDSRLGRVEHELAALPDADLVVTNPPRAGMDASVVSGLVERPAVRIAYISCDPATLARDVKRLAARYTVTDVRAFDLFPQTASVETVVALASR